MNLNPDIYKTRDGESHYRKTRSARTISFLYENAIGRAFLKIMIAPGTSRLMQKFLDSKVSTSIISTFIKKNNIDLSEYQKVKYKSFNDFFTRKIIADKRIISEDNNSLISPSDGKISVFRINDDSVFKIKNSFYTVNSLIRNSELAGDFKNGYFILIRLSVEDYHRYCYAISGNKSKEKRIRGYLHTVNPHALKHCKVYKENCREYCTINNDSSSIIQMEVGAMGVGKIVNSLKGKGYVYKGSEKGFFAFGGSSIVLLLKENQFIIDEDILKNSDDGFETKIKYGEKIGKINVE